jgi:hypothetical protein
MVVGMFVYVFVCVCVCVERGVGVVRLPDRLPEATCKNRQLPDWTAQEQCID